MNKIKLAVGIILLLLLGAVAGSVGTGIYIRHRIEHIAPAKPHKAHFLLRKLSRELDLTEVQQVEIGKILEESHTEITALRRKFLPEIKELHEITNHNKIEIIEGAVLKSIGGENLVSHITLMESHIERLDLDGVFIILESVPTTALMNGAGVSTDGGGCIVVDKNQSTNVDGIFAAGDCVCGGMQVVTAAGDGSRAGLSALRYVRSYRK